MTGGTFNLDDATTATVIIADVFGPAQVDVAVIPRWRTDPEDLLRKPGDVIWGTDDTDRREAFVAALRAVVSALEAAS